MGFNKFTVAASGGSNSNSGSSASVVYTTSGATWDGSANITGITGAGAVQVGDWVNVGGSYLAQVVTNGTTSLVLSTTAKYGTAPTAGSYTITDGGYFSSLAAITSIFGTATVYNSTCFQIQQGNSALTLSGALTLGVVGTTTAPVWYRGYNATPGDLDNGSSSLSYPTIAAGSNLLQSTGAFATFTGFAITANRAGPALTVSTGANQSFRHCRLSNSDANAAAFAVTLNISSCEFTACLFSSTSTSTEIVNASNNGGIFVGCWFAGAAAGSTQVGLSATTGNNLYVLDCTFYKCGSSGIKFASTSQLLVNGCTFYKCGSDSITLSSVPSTFGAIINNAFIDSGTNGSGYDVNNSSGTNTARVLILNNDYYNPASAHTNGLGDTVMDNELQESALPVVSDSNLSLLSTAVGANAAIPGQWEGQTAGLGGFGDVGAWQRTVTSGGGVVGAAAMLSGGRM